MSMWSKQFIPLRPAAYATSREPVNRNTMASVKQKEMYCQERKTVVFRHPSLCITGLHDAVCLRIYLSSVSMIILFSCSAAWLAAYKRYKTLVMLLMLTPWSVSICSLHWFNQLGTCFVARSIIFNNRKLAGNTPSYTHAKSIVLYCMSAFAHLFQCLELLVLLVSWTGLLNWEHGPLEQSLWHKRRKKESRGL